MNSKARALRQANRLRAVAWLLLAWLGNIECMGAESSEKPRVFTRASDATIRALASMNADRIWTAGCRGLIMASDNGGRTWTEQASATTDDLEGIAFDDARVGWAVGGSIQPYSHRSVGVLLATRDGGQSWRSIGTQELPRLRGIRSFGGGHLLVWGDWSPVYQSGLIESFDGGMTWNPRPLNAAHVRCTAWRDPLNGIIVDRLSRIFVVKSGAAAAQVPFAGDPTVPILACATNEHGWWLAGEAGQVYWSRDGMDWIRRPLPGRPSDHQLIAIHSIALHGDDVWLAGIPGNVIWHSNDRGRHWEVQSLSTSLPNYCVGALTEDCIVAAGGLANIQATRNRGAGWWTVHSLGSRIALLNVAATLDDVAWDAVAYLANETRHQAAVYVLHPQNIHQRASASPERDQRLSGLSNPLGLALFEVSSAFPIGDLPQGRRDSDMAAYRSPSDEASPVTRRLVQWLRMTRPETIVCDEKASDDRLLSTAHDTVKNARRLASESNFYCFSPEAMIQEKPWNCKRILARSSDRGEAAVANARRHHEIRFAPTTALRASGKLLGEWLSSVVPLSVDLSESSAEQVQQATHRLYAHYATVFGATSKSKDQLLTDGISPQETKRPSLGLRSANLQTMMAGTQQAALISRMLEMNGPDLLNDPRWQSALKSLLRTIPAPQHPEVLWKLSQEYRQRGDWNRWQNSLQKLIVETPRSAAAELACLQLLQFAGSEEVRLLRHRQSQKQADVEGSGGPSIHTLAISSPFARNMVETASHPSVPPTDADPIAEAFQRVRANLPMGYPVLHADPRSLSIETAFQRKAAASSPRENAIRSASLLRLANCHGVIDWHAVASQELALIRRTVGLDDEQTSRLDDGWAPHPIQKVNGRPKLDGRLDEEIWSQALPLPLERVWLDASADGSVTFAWDDDFLYIAAAFSRNGIDLARGASDPEVLTLRFDTDRDYLSWFQLEIDEQGKAIERCNDMRLWQPEWYFKTESDPTGWRFEAAIPLAELQLEPLVPEQVWGIAVHRSIPSHGTQSTRSMLSDRLLLTSPRLFRFAK